MNKRTAGILSVVVLAARLICAETHTVPLVASAGDPDVQGFVRVVNLSDQAGTVTIVAYTDVGVRWGETSFRIDGNEVFGFNSDDLEYGSNRKGIEGIGVGTSDWHLTVSSDLPITVTAYLRTRDGFLTSMNRTVPRDPDGIYRVMTFNPASNTRLESRLRLVNMNEERVTVTIKGMDDRGEQGDDSVMVTVPGFGTQTITARHLEANGFGDGFGKWRLFVTASEPIMVMSLLKAASGHLTNLSSAPEPALEDYVPYRDNPSFGENGEVIPLFTRADTFFTQSFLRIINRSDGSGTVIVEATDDDGIIRGLFRIPIAPYQVLHFNSDDLENGNADKGIPGVGSGTGDWRLTVKSDWTGIEPFPDDTLKPLDLRVLAYMRTRDGFLTALHDLVHDMGHHQVPIFNPGSNVNQESKLRIINTADTTTTVTIRGVNDAGSEGEETVSVTLPGNTVRSIPARELEAEGLGDGSGKWRLLVTADNPVGIMSLMYTVSGHLTNLSYLPETERVIAGTLSASFTYTEDDGVPFGIRFNAGSSTGDITRYTWDFGETSRLVEITPGTGTTSFFGYDDTWSYGSTRGDTYGYDGRYPHRATYQVTLTAIDRHGRSVTRTKRVRVTNTLRFPGLRDLIGRINDRGGHRGKLVIWEPLYGRVFEDSHAKRTVFSSMGEEGVPAANIVTPIPDVRKGVADFLTHPRTRAVRNETLVVNQSVFALLLQAESSGNAGSPAMGWDFRRSGFAGKAHSR